MLLTEIILRPFLKRKAQKDAETIQEKKYRQLEEAIDFFKSPLMLFVLSANLDELRPKKKP